MLIITIVCCNLRDFLRSTRHLKVFIKKLITHTEFVKAKEIEGNGKERSFSLLMSVYFVDFVYKNTRHSVLPMETDFRVLYLVLLESLDVLAQIIFFHHISLA